MSKEPPRILAINPGSRYIGFAAFRGPELLDWGVKAIRTQARRNGSKVVGAILTEAVERFRPDMLVVKRLHESRGSPELADQIKTINQISRYRRLRLSEYSLEQVKDVLLPKTKANKRRLAECVATTYAVLSRDFQKEEINRNAYYLRMFEAVALGVVCYRSLEE